jgi:hypothetical protein
MVPWPEFGHPWRSCGWKTTARGAAELGRLSEGRVGPPPEHQRRRPAAARFRVPDAPDDNLVVSAGVELLCGALDDGEYVRKPRAAHGPRRCRTSSQATARPPRAKLADRRWRAPSTLTANEPWLRTACKVALARPKQTRMSGGSSESEVTALALVPTGSPSSPADLTTVTRRRSAPWHSGTPTPKRPRIRVRRAVERGHQNCPGPGGRASFIMLTAARPVYVHWDSSQRSCPSVGDWMGRKAASRSLRFTGLPIA